MVATGELAKLLAAEPSWLTEIKDLLKRSPPSADMVAGASTVIPATGAYLAAAARVAVVAAAGKNLAGSPAFTVQDVLSAYQGVLAEGQTAGKKPALLMPN